MSEPKSTPLTPELHAYLVEHGTPPDEVLRDLTAATGELGPIARMQIAPEQGAFMTVLTRAIGARRAIEVGTFTGYSALCVARGLPADGHLLCCDVSEEWTAIARDAWAAAGVADRIELRIGPAIDTLRALPDTEDVDVAFLDADKVTYVAYYEELVRRLRPNGLLLVDNVFQGGRVIDPEAADDNTDAIRTFNTHVVGDDRVDAVMLPIADGLTLVRRR